MYPRRVEARIRESYSFAMKLVILLMTMARNIVDRHVPKETSINDVHGKRGRRVLTKPVKSGVLDFVDV